MSINATNNQYVFDVRLENKNEETQKSNSSTTTISTQKPSLLLSKRLLVTLLLFLTNVCMTLIRYNLSIAIIEMTSAKEIFVNENLTMAQEAEFQWDSRTIGVLLSIYFYGKLLSLFSGSIISKFGSSTSMTLSLMAASIITVLQPITLYYNFNLFLFSRFLIGMFEGFCASSLTTTCSHWMPTSERASLISFCYNGLYVGASVVHPICGFIAHRWGWSMVFYITGAISITLSMFCLVLIRNHPSEDKWISKKELSFILQETETMCATKAITHPYKKVLTSVPIWALHTAYFVSGWIITTALSSIPLFVKDSTGKDTQDVAFISSLPAVIGIIVSSFAGTILDYFKNKNNIDPTTLHKIVMCGAFVGQMFSLVALVFVRDLIIIMIIFFLIRLFIPFIFLLLQLISVNIAPNHTGFVAGLSQLFFSLSPIIAQMVTGFMTVDHTLTEWYRCFMLTSGVLLLGAIIFCVFGSSEAQAWSLSSNIEKKSNPSCKHQTEQVL